MREDGGENERKRWKGDERGGWEANCCVAGGLPAVTRGVYLASITGQTDYMISYRESRFRDQRQTSPKQTDRARPS